MATMSMRRRAAAGAMLVAGTFGVGVLCWPHPAVAQEPDIAAWWNAANPGDPAPAPPPPPDVNSGDLFVQGSNTVPTPGAPVTSAPGSAQAVAALEFDLQPTDVVGALTLGIDGTAPPQVSVVACRATEHFTNVENGPWSRAPAYDANACTPGALKDGKVVFADIGKLVQDAQLAVVLLPGPVDRIVFAKPGPNALEVTHAGSVGTGAPSFGSGTGGGSSSSFGGGAVAPAAGPAGAPAAPDLPPVTSTSTGGDVPPVVAGSSPPAPASAAGATPAAAATSSGLSTSARRWLALVIIALEVVGFAALRRVPETAPLPATAAAAAAGGRLRPPDRTPGGARAGRAASATIGGVGRFRRERHAAAPPV